MFNEKPHYELTVRRELSEFICTTTALMDSLVQHNQPERSSQNLLHEQRVQQLLNHIHTHFDETITLDSLAALISVSPSEVLRCFKAVIGLSPIRYVKNYRLHSAAHLLSDTDYPIRTVYEMCGFDDSSYFSKSFKEVYGKSPREYRSKQ